MSYTKKCNFISKCFTRKCKLNLFFDKQFSTSVISYTLYYSVHSIKYHSSRFILKTLPVGVWQQQRMSFVSNLPSLYWMMLSAAGIHLSRAVPPPTTIPSSTAALGRGESASLLTNIFCDTKAHNNQAEHLRGKGGGFLWVEIMEIGFFMSSKSITMVTIAIFKIGCHGYHSNTPEQHKINSYLTIFLIHPRNTLIKSLSG